VSSLIGTRGETRVSVHGPVLEHDAIRQWIIIGAVTFFCLCFVIYRFCFLHTSAA